MRIIASHNVYKKVTGLVLVCGLLATFFNPLLFSANAAEAVIDAPIDSKVAVIDNPVVEEAVVETVQIASVDLTGAEVVYRVNTGGGAVSGWLADKAWDSQTFGYVLTGEDGSYASTATIQNIGTVPAGVYQTERWSDKMFSYRFKVADGEYGVRLHFAELWFNGSSTSRPEKTGNRIFNVTAEGQAVLSGYDITAVAGEAEKGVTEVFATEVADGVLEITFVPQVQNPKINGIEVYALLEEVAPPQEPPADTQNPVVAITAPTTASTYSTQNTSITLSGTSSDNVGVTQVVWSCPTCSPTTGTAQGTASWNTGSIIAAVGTHTISLVAYDAAGNFGTKSLVVTVSSPATPPPAPTGKIQNISANKTSLLKYEKFEVDFDINQVYVNVFDPAIVKVDLLVTQPSGGQLTVPAFYNQDYTITGQDSSGWPVLEKVHGNNGWKARFTPTQSGSHGYKIQVTDAAGVTTSGQGTFTVSSTPANKGFVRADGYKFKFDNGENYFPIGATNSWCNLGASFAGCDNKRSLYGLESFIDKTTANGGNWNRLWLDTGSWSEPSLEEGMFYWNMFANSNTNFDSSVKHGGNNSLKVSYTAATNQTIMRQRKHGWNMESGHTYQLQACVKTENVAGSAVVRFPAINVTMPSATGTKDWQCFTQNYTATKNIAAPAEFQMTGFSGTIWFDDIRMIDTATGYDIAWEGDFERGFNYTDRYSYAKINLDDAYILDKIIEYSEQKGVYQQLLFRSECSTDSRQTATYDKYMRYLVARYGYSTAVLSWEFCNENFFDVSWLNSRATVLQNLDPFNHLRTTSFWSGAIDASIYSLPTMTLANLHHYRKDGYSPSLFGLNPSDSRFDTVKYYTGPRSLKLGVGATATHKPKVTVEAGKNYEVSFYAKGENVVRGGNYPWIFVREYSPAGQQVGNGFSINAGLLGDSGKGTLDWFKTTKVKTVTAGVNRWDIEVNTNNIKSGTVWFDEIVVKDASGIVVYQEGFDSSGKPIEDWAWFGYQDGKIMRANSFNKPAFGGEHGIEVSSSIARSPYIDQDTSGIHFHNWLWGTAFSGMSGATGMWWFLPNSITHQKGLAEYISKVEPDFVNLTKGSSLELGSFTSTSQSDLVSYVKRGSTKVYGYLKHKDYTLAAIVRDKITPSAIATQSIVRVTGATNGNYTVDWYNTITGAKVSTTQASAVGGILSIATPQALTSDIAFIATVSGGSVPSIIFGCTDPNATNYNSSATQSDGSCLYPPTPVLGCTDSSATNYNPSATQSDGSCLYPPTPVLGCTDPIATNYNVLATQNDGTCIYPPINVNTNVNTNVNIPVNTNTNAPTNQELITLLQEKLTNLEYKVSELEQDVIDLERRLVTSVDAQLTAQLEGQILLQVEEGGRAWYVDPVTDKKYYLKDGDSAYTAFSAFGLGITDQDLSKIPVSVDSATTTADTDGDGLDNALETAIGTDPTDADTDSDGYKDGVEVANRYSPLNVGRLPAELERYITLVDADTDGDGLTDKLEEAIGTNPNNPDTDGDGYKDGVEVANEYSPIGPGRWQVDKSLIARLKGRILLQVQKNGQAWYVNPVDGKRYYLRDGSKAYELMRNLSLGISNTDIRKIEVGSFQ